MSSVNVLQNGRDYVNEGTFTQRVGRVVVLSVVKHSRVTLLDGTTHRTHCICPYLVLSSLSDRNSTYTTISRAT